MVEPKYTYPGPVGEDVWIRLVRKVSRKSDKLKTF